MHFVENLAYIGFASSIIYVGEKSDRGNVFHGNVLLVETSGYELEVVRSRAQGVQCTPASDLREPQTLKPRRHQRKQVSKVIWQMDVLPCPFLCVCGWGVLDPLVRTSLRRKLFTIGPAVFHNTP